MAAVLVCIWRRLRPGRIARSFAAAFAASICAGHALRPSRLVLVANAVRCVIFIAGGHVCVGAGTGAWPAAQFVVRAWALESGDLLRADAGCDPVTSPVTHRYGIALSRFDSRKNGSEALRAYRSRQSFSTAACGDFRHGLADFSVLQSITFWWFAKIPPENHY